MRLPPNLEAEGMTTLQDSRFDMFDAWIIEGHYRDKRWIVCGHMGYENVILHCNKLNNLLLAYRDNATIEDRMRIINEMRELDPEALIGFGTSQYEIKKVKMYNHIDEYLELKSLAENE